MAIRAAAGHRRKNSESWRRGSCRTRMGDGWTAGETGHRCAHDADTQSHLHRNANPTAFVISSPCLDLWESPISSSSPSPRPRPTPSSRHQRLCLASRRSRRNRRQRSALSEVSSRERRLSTCVSSGSRGVRLSASRSCDTVSRVMS